MLSSRALPSTGRCGYHSPTATVICCPLTNCHVLIACAHCVHVCNLIRHPELLRVLCLTRIYWASVLCYSHEGWPGVLWHFNSFMVGVFPPCIQFAFLGWLPLCSLLVDTWMWGELQVLWDAFMFLFFASQENQVRREDVGTYVLREITCPVLWSVKWSKGLFLILVQLDQLTVDFGSRMHDYSCVTCKDSCWVHILTHKV